jgi:hypothetical protein
VPVKYAAWRLDNLPIPRRSELGRARTAFRLLDQLLDVAEDPLDELSRCLGLVEGDVIRNGVEVIESRFRPD